MKKIVIGLIIGLALVSGCVNTKSNANYENVNTPTYHNNGSFNDETYVWEQFIFTTNRVEKVK